MEKLNISNEEIFLGQQDLVNKKIKELSSLDIDFSPQRTQIQSHFNKLEEVASHTDRSFIGAVKAQKIKQLKGLDNLEKRLLKAEKRKHQEVTERIKSIQDEIFPMHSLQERNTNFSEFYLQYGGHLIPIIKESLEPLKGEFTIISL